jgi:hypothetical protein
VKCGWIAEKRLDNLIYRKEQCPVCGAGVFEETLAGQLSDLMNMLTGFRAEIFARLTSGGNVKADTTSLKSLYRRYIAKKGVKVHGRKMMSDEWFALSHILSEELMREVASNRSEFEKWEEFYSDLLSDHPTKQGQDILPAVIPATKHRELTDAIAKRLVKL